MSKPEMSQFHKRIEKILGIALPTLMASFVLMSMFNHKTPEPIETVQPVATVPPVETKLK